MCASRFEADHNRAAATAIGIHVASTFHELQLVGAKAFATDTASTAQGWPLVETTRTK
jgi:hypothetical protein